MTQKECVDKAGMCGKPGPSLWSAAGGLIPTLCMKILNHLDPHEYLSGEFLLALEIDWAETQADLRGFLRGKGEAGNGENP